MNLKEENKQILKSIRWVLQLFILFAVSAAIISVSFLIYDWFKATCFHNSNVLVNGKLSTDAKEIVDKQIWEWISRISFVIGVVAAILGYFGLKSFDLLVERKIEKKTEENLKSTFLKFKIDHLRLSYLEAKSMSSWTAWKFFERYQQKGRELLKEVEGVDEPDEMLSEILGSLIILGSEAGKYEDTYNLIEPYKERNLKLSYDVWANMGIINMTLYAKYFNSDHRDMALQACKKALIELPDYGSAYSVEVLTYMIDISENNPLDSKIKEESLKKTRNILNRIISYQENKSYTLWEFFNYLNLYFTKTYVATEHAKKLDEKFKDEMEKIRKIYNENGKKDRS